MSKMRSCQLTTAGTTQKKKRLTRRPDLVPRPYGPSCQLIDITGEIIAMSRKKMDSITHDALPLNRRTLEGGRIIHSSAIAERATGTFEAGASSTSLTEDAEVFLRSFAGAPDNTDSPVAWCRSLASSVHRTSKARHLRAIAFAHAFFLRLDNLPGRELVLRELERAVGRKRSKRTRDLHIVVENFISYDMGSPEERAAARKLASRDARAIEFLRKKKIRPSQVEALAREKGEGLDRWSRGAAVPRLKQQPSLSPQRDARERGFRHVLIHIVQQPDGTEVEREKIAVTGVLAGDVERAVERFKKLGA